MQELQNVFWSRPKVGREAAQVARPAPKSRVPQKRAVRIRFLTMGLFYVGLFTVALFMEVYLKTRLKSYSLDLWMLSRQKAELETELTRLDMRLTVLESPTRIESLALSEIGLQAAELENGKAAKK